MVGLDAQRGVCVRCRRRESGERDEGASATGGAVLTRRRGLRLRSVASAMNGLESSLTRVVGRAARVGGIGNHAILPDGVWIRVEQEQHS